VQVKQAAIVAVAYSHCFHSPLKLLFVVVAVDVQLMQPIVVGFFEAAVVAVAELVVVGYGVVPPPVLGFEQGFELDLVIETSCFCFLRFLVQSGAC
jgi:hypothetical protein